MSKNVGTKSLFPESGKNEMTSFSSPLRDDKQKKSGAIILLSLAFMLSSPAVFALSRFESLTEQAESAYRAKRYPEAQEAFEGAIKEADKLDKGDKRIATAVYNLALVFQAEGKYADAEKNMLKAIELMTQYYGAEHQRTAQVYMDLGDLYVEEAGQESNPELKKKAAENYKKGIEIFEKIYANATGEEGGTPAPAPADKSAEPKTKADKKAEADKEKKSAAEAASDLSNALRLFADSYLEDELYDQAEPLYKRSLELEEYAEGPDSKDLIRHKAKLAESYCVQAKYKLARPYFDQALAGSEKVNGPDSQETGDILYKYGGLHYDEGEFGEAEIKFKKAVKIFGTKPDFDKEDLAQKTIALGDVLDMQGKAEEAQAVYMQLMPTFEASADKASLVRFLKQYQKHLLMQNKKDEAGKIAARIRDIKSGGSDKK
jgi:Tfp pilus assembly protein PilF